MQRGALGEHERRTRMAKFVWVPVPESGPLAQRRTRTAIGRVVGEDQVPEDPSRYRPHVSVAYLTAAGPAEPYIEAVRSIAPEPAVVTISHVDLIEMHRDRRMYEWQVVARMPLG